ncbi:MAG: hypothetical protein IKF09_03010 [Clostridiales bacterium]|nr:hypothetical protein [Clostridiales bacterium]
MSKDDRKTSKLAIAGLIVAVAAPCQFFLFGLANTCLNKYLDGILDGLLLLFLILPCLNLSEHIAILIMHTLISY